MAALFTGVGWGTGRFISIDCRAIRSRKEALRRIAGSWKVQRQTPVFKSPHLMHADAQLKLARQIGSRQLADSQPPATCRARSLRGAVAGYPEHLMRFGGLQEKLASVFAGYLIHVPPSGTASVRCCAGPTRSWPREAGAARPPDQRFYPGRGASLLRHDWPGISARCASVFVQPGQVPAGGSRPWISACSRGLSAEPAATAPGDHPFLQSVMEPQREEESYSASPDDLRVALGIPARHAGKPGDKTPGHGWRMNWYWPCAERFQGNKRAAEISCITRSPQYQPLVARHRDTWRGARRQFCGRRRANWSASG